MADPLAVTFGGGLDGLFFRLRPKRSRLRQRVARLRRMPSSGCVLLCNGAKVGSGCARIEAGMRGSAAVSRRRCFCPPPWGPAVKVPVVR